MQSDIDFYEESLEKLKDDTIKDGSKLLEQENHYSLLAMMVYSYQEDKDLEEWMTQYAVKNEFYFTDQKKNFLYMKEDYAPFIGSKKRTSDKLYYRKRKTVSYNRFAAKNCLLSVKY